jgi:hypothetical protein
MTWGRRDEPRWACWLRQVGGADVRTLGMNCLSVLCDHPVHNEPWTPLGKISS